MFIKKCSANEFTLCTLNSNKSKYKAIITYDIILYSFKDQCVTEYS